MVVLYHNGAVVEEVFPIASNTAIYYNSSTIAKTLFAVAQDYPEAILVWLLF